MSSLLNLVRPIGNQIVISPQTGADLVTSVNNYFGSGTNTWSVPSHVTITTGTSDVPGYLTYDGSEGTYVNAYIPSILANQHWYKTLFDITSYTSGVVCCPITAVSSNQIN